MADLKIESGIPYPPTGVGRRTGGITDNLRRLAAARVGDSILIPDGCVKPQSIGNLLLSAAGKGWARTAKVDGGVRVWKMAEPAKVGVQKREAR